MITFTGRTLTLQNTFHGTSAVVQPREVLKATKLSPEEPARLGLSHRQILRARRKLCGIEDCLCGGYAGEHEGRYWVDLYHQDEVPSRNVYTLHDGHVGLMRDDRLSL